MSTHTAIHARSPLRIDFVGMTDYVPACRRFGGSIVNATMNKYIYASVRERHDQLIILHAPDREDKRVVVESKEALDPDAELGLAQEIVRRFDPPHGLELTTYSEMPAGAGLGSSSTIATCIIAALDALTGFRLSAYEMAELAYLIERVDLGIAGGRQDQYAAAFGGFNFIEFQKDATIVNALRVPEAALRELEYRLLLCYLKQTRSSADIITRQRASYVARKRSVVQALDALKASTYEMKRALLLGDIDGFGAILHEAWLAKKRLDAGISTGSVDALYEQARRAGAIGGKMPGAGGGGYFLVLCRADRRHAVARALEAAGGVLVPFAFTHEGVTAWTAGKDRPGAARRARA